ncbi:SDR family NAD(P)-dependent oxidoreductase [Streptomyces sp. NPDC057654]|uniref:SDR family NAD(P)-dependent oxidoreductase n=1 Tax=Streptomyces sp. NPDC057654 TaxID=3346196 RepID=UPI0036A1DB45
MGQLDNKTALVTGASSGIGLAIARRFAAEGATVYLTGRRKAALDAAVEQVGAVAQVGARGIAVQGDTSDLGDLDRLFVEIENRSGRLDIVVANAGVGDYGPLGAITEEEYERTTAINFKGTVFTVQKALPLLTAGSSVLLLSSSSALRAAPGLGVYAATKAAIRSLARTWAAELADRRIRVNALTPGPVETPGLNGLLAAFPHADDPTAVAPTAAEPTPPTPLGRRGRPDEVAATALYLAGDQSTFTTGAELLVDGGATQL